jgi:hypothetical protein
MEQSLDFIRRINESAWRDCVYSLSATREAKDSKNDLRGSSLNQTQTVPFLTPTKYEKPRVPQLVS